MSYTSSARAAREDRFSSNAIVKTILTMGGKKMKLERREGLALLGARVSSLTTLRSYEGRRSPSSVEDTSICNHRRSEIAMRSRIAFIDVSHGVWRSGADRTLQASRATFAQTQEENATARLCSAPDEDSNTRWLRATYTSFCGCALLQSYTLDEYAPHCDLFTVMALDCTRGNCLRLHAAPVFQSMVFAIAVICAALPATIPAITHAPPTRVEPCPGRISDALPYDKITALGLLSAPPDMDRRNHLLIIIF
ncbi:hypothetical protein HPB50_006928 [Hyalomma asiaticum]|uniref:Uncharacterized protein n=1 Tax=Hyalomma asiaticum TaxID=266040 RepID=A0ACB7RMA4_HYAAI|nr:hypothetical protein HPB50_006928 [Hyalomma asiaticum]